MATLAFALANEWRKREVNYSTDQLRDRLISAGYRAHGSRALALGDLTTVANTIQTVEGWFPGSVSYRSNNPGNLVCAGQPGVVSCNPGSNIAVFDSYQDGFTALENQISLDASRGETISQFTAKYAPASAGNNPTSYAQTIASAEGLDPNDLLSEAIASNPSDGSTINLSTDDSDSDDSGGLSDFLSSTVTIAGMDVPTVAVALGALGAAALLWFAFSD